MDNKGPYEGYTLVDETMIRNIHEDIDIVLPVITRGITSYYSGSAIYWLGNKSTPEAIVKQWKPADVDMYRQQVLSHDQLPFLTRWFRRLFSNIEQKRALLCYAECKEWIEDYYAYESSKNPLRNRSEKIEALTRFARTEGEGWLIAKQIQKLSRWSRLHNYAQSVLRHIKEILKTLNTDAALIPHPQPPVVLASDSTLGLSRNPFAELTTHQSLRKEYLKLARALHPDLSQKDRSAFQAMHDYFLAASASLKPVEADLKDTTFVSEYEQSLINSGLNPAEVREQKEAFKQIAANYSRLVAATDELIVGVTALNVRLDVLERRESGSSVTRPALSVSPAFAAATAHTLWAASSTSPTVPEAGMVSEVAETRETTSNLSFSSGSV